MNRELKFRVWSKGLQRFYKNEYFNEDIYAENDKTITLNCLEQIWQQYTGLKDKNGIEIYEGDLVCCSTDQYSITAPVVFSPFGYGFVLDSSGRHGIGDSKHGGYISLISPIVSDEKITYEVVGNIFENKTNE